MEMMEKRMRQMLEMSEHDYEKLKKQVLSGVKLKTSFPMKYHPVFVSQRKFMKRLQDAGYNDLFIPSMIALSPAYKRYHDALTAINRRLCDDLGLYYDSNYVLRLKKKAPAQ